MYYSTIDGTAKIVMAPTSLANTSRIKENNIATNVITTTITTTTTMATNATTNTPTTVTANSILTLKRDMNRRHVKTNSLSEKNDQNFNELFGYEQSSTSKPPLKKPGLLAINEHTEKDQENYLKLNMLRKRLEGITITRPDKKSNNTKHNDIKKYKFPFTPTELDTPQNILKARLLESIGTRPSLNNHQRKGSEKTFGVMLSSLPDKHAIRNAIMNKNDDLRGSYGHIRLTNGSDKENCDEFTMDKRAGIAAYDSIDKKGLVSDNSNRRILNLNTQCINDNKHRLSEKTYSEGRLCHDMLAETIVKYRENNKHDNDDEIGLSNGSSSNKETNINNHNKEGFYRHKKHSASVKNLHDIMYPQGERIDNRDKRGHKRDKSDKWSDKGDKGWDKGDKGWDKGDKGWDKCDKIWEKGWDKDDKAWDKSDKVWDNGQKVIEDKDDRVSDKDDNKPIGRLTTDSLIMHLGHTISSKIPHVISNTNVCINNNLKSTGYKNDHPKHLDDYIVKKIIGIGTYAVVRIAQDERTSTKYAIKTYDKYKILDINRRKNLRREISILSSLDHPNVIKLHKTIDTPTQIHLVMEYIGNTSLYQHINAKPNRRLEEKDARLIFKQIVNGIAYCHKNNICHRDIKLENVLLSEDYTTVKIIDFGFSIHTQPNKPLAQICGTPSYMAPELMNKKEYIGYLSDSWALGVLLYVLLIGKFPFVGHDEKELSKNITKGKYELPVELTRQAQALLEKLLRVDPNLRATAEEVTKDIWVNAHDTSIGILRGNYFKRE